MDGVKRYNFFCSTDVSQEGRNADFVLASDFDGLQASHNLVMQQWHQAVEQRDGFKVELNSAQSELAALREELATAEQRNAELESWCMRIMNSSETMLSTAHEEELFALVEPADAEGYGNTKPTESGASDADHKADDDALQRRHDQERQEYFNDESGASE